MSFPGLTGIGAAAASPKFGGPGSTSAMGGNADPNEAAIKMMQSAMESCYVKLVTSGVVGFGLGGVFGLFMASMAYDTPYHTATPPAATAAATSATSTSVASTSATSSSTTTSTATKPAAATAPATAPAAPAPAVPKGPLTAAAETAAANTAKAMAATGSGAGTATTSAVLNPTFDTIAAMPLRQQLAVGFRDMGARSWSSAKNFGTVGALFTGIECGIEGLRAKNDIGNGVAAGCLTGAILARNAGPQAAAVGCAGFAAFSAAIDAYMRMPPDDD